jgi:hypothetical protein
MSALLFPADPLESAGKGPHNGAMEQNSAVDHETTLERALDIARRNAKEAKRLFDDALAKRDAHEIDDARVKQLEELMIIANEDLLRVTREQ